MFKESFCIMLVISWRIGIPSILCSPFQENYFATSTFDEEYDDFDDQDFLIHDDDENYGLSPPPGPGVMRRQKRASGYEPNKTLWHNYTMRIFRQSDKNYPRREEELFNSSCDYGLYMRYSPIYQMAFPLNDTDEKNIELTLERVKNIWYARRLIVWNGAINSVPGGQALYTMWKYLILSASDYSEKYKGRLLEEKICYRRGFELLECNRATSKCDCPKEGQMKFLRLKYMPLVKKKQQTVQLKYWRCMAADCGWCLTQSEDSLCGLWGDCHDSLIFKNFPYNHVNGTCKGSMYNLNYFPEKWADDIKDLFP